MERARNAALPWIAAAAAATLVAAGSASAFEAGTRPRADAAASPAQQEAELFAGVATALEAAPDDGLFEALPLPAAEPGRRGRLPVAAFRAPERLRPCCAFGHALAVDLMGIPLPGVHLDNVVAPDRLGRHHYDAGVLAWENGLERAFVSSEANGLVYTRRGGFVDVAHVRQWADWTVYLAQEVAARLPDGGAIELPGEGGRRVVHLERVQPGWLRRVGRDEAAVALAQWIAWQLSVWHELATLYGWSSTPLFPERVSAFSPEDLYSNLLGIQLAGAVLRAGGAETRERWERNVDAALPEVLRRLGAVDREQTGRAAALVDGFWWDSRRALPNPDLVLQRNPVLGPRIVPWRVALPDELGAPSDDRARPLAAAGPAILHVVDRVGDSAAGALAGLEVCLSDAVAGAMPASLRAGRALTQDQFAPAARAIAGAPR